jgi:hephaestin
MRVPVVLALAVPVLVVGGGIAVYSYARPASGHSRTYYIAADEVAYGAAQGGQAGYRTAVYQEYTDASFTRVKPRPAEWRHLSFLGPLIRANVGDTVRVVFRNRLGFAANVHPDAVLHRPDPQDALSVAAPADGTPLGEDHDDSVAPGATRTYLWPVPAEAGPGPDDHGSVLWLYHSHTGQPTGVEAGLIGPMIIYKRGALH